ncbi:RNA-binding domain-containing protein [Chloropicon primus]|uniref:RNA-binding domain-containing protein n=1 Tax=Chloropicon primus TaxID=1764295 RepID=A0A5B8MLT0_9CHLO|nr:RNA-binding domain-containing protein [Chloropicon primus]UPR00621.1 RNA-binding domain-containing protein [Chloropicon primus]|mmetsp:Transcript_5624/g.17085  ORF Transcript_5624/g.17085 Transcript_5624/m.17085 type:complete len:294 (+) Transcript_5624:108-989(+)|eukprot:QDZ21407.1 RNA-binding domain-containing protein [Chloropicon primus]
MATDGEDAFAAFMGEVNELSEKADRKGETAEEAEAAPAPPAQKKSPPPPRPPPAKASARTPMATVASAPKPATKREGGSAPYYVQPGVGSHQSSGAKSIMERDYEKLQEAARYKSGLQGQGGGAGAESGMGRTREELVMHRTSPQGGCIYRKDRAEPSQKVFVREIGGEKWVDPTLGEWPENDFRLFAGDLGPEVTDDLLAQTFSRYKSFNKAKVVKEKRTQKSRGFGFVSFADGADFAKALREMNGKYIGNRPCKLKKSDWKQRGTNHSKSLAAGRGIQKKFRKNSKKHLNF